MALLINERKQGIRSERDRQMDAIPHSTTATDGVFGRRAESQMSDLTRQLPLLEVPARFQTALIKSFWRRRGGDLEETLPESDGRSRGYRTAAGGKWLLQPTPEQLQRGDSFSAGEPRVLGLAMVPGHHIVSVEVQRENLTCPPYL
ncbi:N-alpha-acetyltransferase 38, NatC auxiliary subunit isoform X2 [Gracilinanus agilis]|uniref:N-alpha-acetyltransferase 38, NatC auxiliary subunit isoform X2 n=1 Tax=Gracilinanus agilis TaxID=191870 RepID=UPI001CFC51FD|nr:N-alpha-acetyltransferase 38, NatC auxiliary subunit isoform X2 [Gracilinanus agilis]